MPILRGILVLVLLAPFGSATVAAQSLGSLEVSGRLLIGKDKVQLKRKRFYLFRGGLEANRSLVDKLKSAEATTRECFYCKLNASPEYIAWLKAGECESPYCREITTEDITKVPEFKAAYDKGIKLFRGKAPIAQTWLTTQLTPDLRDGFYRQRKIYVDGLLAGSKPLQTAMTDTVAVKAFFIDIPLASDKNETFLVSNVVPIEIGSKSYLWACEISVGGSKRGVLAFKVPEAGKTVPKCEVIVRDLPDCSGGTCKK